MKLDRILVALDASPHSLAALEAAATLAAALEAELLGLFVEDINLLRLAEMPFASEVGHASGSRREIAYENMERSLRSLAESSRHAIERAALRSGVPWSFRTARGSVTDEILSAAEETDLIAIGLTSREAPRRVAPGATALGCVVRGHGPVLILRRGDAIRPPIAVVLDESESDRAALDATAALARVDSEPILVITATDPDATERIESAARAKIEGEGRSCRFLRAIDGLGTLAAALQSTDAGAVVLASRNRMVEGHHLAEVLAICDCPVLLLP